MARAQTPFKGLFARQRIDVMYSAGAQTITADSTGHVLGAGLKISNKANAVLTGDSTGVVLNAGLKVSNKANAVLTGNSTGLITNAQLRLANKAYVSANTTGYLFTAQAAKPSTRTAGYRWTFIQNTTGVCGIGINTTGTTWKFANVTSVLPT